MKSVFGWLGRNWHGILTVVFGAGFATMTAMWYLEVEAHKNVATKQSEAIRELEKQEALIGAGQATAEDMASYINSANKIIENLRGELAKLTQEHKDLTAAHGLLTREKTRLDEDHASLRGTWNNLRASYDSLGALNRVNITAYNRLATENSELGKELGKVTGNFNELGQKNTQLTQQFNDLSKNHNELTGKVTDLTAKSAQLAQQLTQAQGQIAQLNSQIGKLTAENERLRQAATPPASGSTSGGR